MIKNLIWDFDGTLFDTYPAFTGAFVSALNRYGHPVNSDEVLRLARVGLSHCAAQLGERYDLTKEELVQAFQEEYSAIDYEKQSPMPYALHLCRYIMGCLGCNFIVTHRGRQSTAAILRAHDVENLFQDIVAGDDGYPRKPDPAGMEAIVMRNGLDKEETIAIGDREIDAEAGKLVGLRTCILGRGDREFTATYFVSNLSELKQIIMSENVG